MQNFQPKRKLRTKKWRASKGKSKTKPNLSLSLFRSNSNLLCNTRTPSFCLACSHHREHLVCIATNIEKIPYPLNALFLRAQISGNVLTLTSGYFKTFRAHTLRFWPGKQRLRRQNERVHKKKKKTIARWSRHKNGPDPFEKQNITKQADRTLPPNRTRATLLVLVVVLLFEHEPRSVSRGTSEKGKSSCCSESFFVVFVYVFLLCLPLSYIRKYQNDWPDSRLRCTCSTRSSLFALKVVGLSYASEPDTKERKEPKKEERKGRPWKADVVRSKWKPETPPHLSTTTPFGRHSLWSCRFTPVQFHSERIPTIFNEHLKQSRTNKSCRHWKQTGKGQVEKGDDGKSIRMNFGIRHRQWFAEIRKRARKRQLSVRARLRVLEERRTAKTAIKG